MTTYFAGNWTKERNPWINLSPRCINGCSQKFVVGWSQADGINHWHCLVCRAGFTEEETGEA